MNRICWNCQYFEHNDSQGTYAGRCRRRAPDGFASNGYAASYLRNRQMIQFAELTNVIRLATTSTVLVLLQEGELPSTASGGYNTGGVWPKLIPGELLSDYHILAAHFICSLANTNAATKDATVTVSAEIRRLTGTTSTQIALIEWSLDQSQVGVAGNVTNLFIHERVELSSSLPVGNLILGSRIQLVVNDPTKVGEIRNPMIGLEVIPVEPISLEAFPWMINGNIEKCGDFKPSAGTIPPLP